MNDKQSLFCIIGLYIVCLGTTICQGYELKAIQNNFIVGINERLDEINSDINNKINDEINYTNDNLMRHKHMYLDGKVTMGGK